MLHARRGFSQRSARASCRPLARSDKPSMDRPAAEPFETSSSARIVELATLVRRANRLAASAARRGTIDRAIAHVRLADRDRFGRIDRRLMPDRLRLPPEIVALLSLELTR